MKAWRDLKAMPRGMWVLFFSTLVNRMGTMALPFLALYLTKSQGYSLSQAATVLATYGAVALFAAPLSGFLTDRFGPIIVMLGSLLLSGVVMILYPRAEGFWWIEVLTILFSLTNEMFRPASQCIVPELVPPELIKTAFALIRWAINLGMSVGPVAGGFLAALSYDWIFIVDGITTLLALVVLLLFRLPTPSASARKSSPRTGLPFMHAIRNFPFLIVLAGILPTSIIFFQSNSTMPLYVVRDLGFSEASFGLLLAINTVLIILIEIPLTSAITAWSYRKSLSLGAALFGIGFGAMTFAHGFWSLAVTVILWTFGEMILFPALSAYVTEIAPAARRGEYMGMLQMNFSLGFTVGPWAGMQVLERFGPAALWETTLALGLGAAVVLAKLPGPAQPICYLPATRSP